MLYFSLKKRIQHLEKSNQTQYKEILELQKSQESIIHSLLTLSKEFLKTIKN